MDWQKLTRTQKIRALVNTFGMSQAQAERDVAIADGARPRDVDDLPPAPPLTPKQ